MCSTECVRLYKYWHFSFHTALELWNQHILKRQGDYCIPCQETGNGELTVPGEKGTNKLKKAMMRRKKLRDSKNRDAIERLKIIMDPSHETSLRWHRMYYSHY